MVETTITVRNTEQPEDEHTYYAIVFIQPDITMNKQLEFEDSSGMDVARFTFWSQSPLVENEKFLVVLVGVFESEQIDILETKIVAKTATPPRDQRVDFNLHG